MSVGELELLRAGTNRIRERVEVLAQYEKNPKWQDAQFHLAYAQAVLEYLIHDQENQKKNKNGDPN